MTGPCSTCPFRRGPLSRWARRTIQGLFPGRLRRFLSLIRLGETAACHDSSGQDVYNRKLWKTKPWEERTACIGALALGRRMERQDARRLLRNEARP